MDKLVRLFRQFFRMALSTRSWYFVSLDFFLHTFCSFDNKSWQLKCPDIASENITVNSFHISGRQAICLKFPITVPLVLSFIMSTVRPPSRFCFDFAAFQLGILARFGSFAVIIIFYYLVVSLRCSFTSSRNQNLYCAPLVQTITCYKIQLIDPFGSGASVCPLIFPSSSL